MRMSGEFHVLAALSSDKVFLLPNGEQHARGRVLQALLRRGKNLITVPGMEATPFSQPARSLVSIPTAVSRLLPLQCKATLNLRLQRTNGRLN